MGSLHQAPLVFAFPPLQANLPIRLFLPYLLVTRLSLKFISILQKTVEKRRWGNKGLLPALLTHKLKPQDIEELVGTLRGENTSRNNSLGLFQTPHASFLFSFQWVSGWADTHGCLLGEYLSNLHQLPPAECVCLCKEVGKEASGLLKWKAGVRKKKVMKITHNT